jgi:hypothetical protein
MQNHASADSLVAAPNCDSHQLIASELRFLIARIEISMRLIEAAMTEQEDEDDAPGSIDIVVLDDVTPGYTTANAALSACRAGLDLAVQCLSDSRAAA